MNWLEKLQHRAKGFTNSIARYPLTAAFLTAAAILISLQIHTNADYADVLWSLAVGVASSACAQAAFERFAQKPSTRVILLAVSAALTAGYYLLARSAAEFTPELEIRTTVALFALVIAYVWMPVIGSKVTFNESYMAAFKAFFHSLLYAAVLMGGCSLILMAIDQLIYPLSDRAYAHTANLIFVLFAPIFFLSLIPVYPGSRQLITGAENGEDARSEAVAKAIRCPKFLEVLISYIVIPLVAVFTVILVAYIVLNVRGKFWTNNLLEPMLVSYAIVVIVVLILSGELQNPFARLFQKVFPKVLIPIVLFQITASALNIRDTGITHPRYFVILFGIFAVLSGGIMSVTPGRRNGLVAALLIAFSAVSVIPPVDAFTVSRISQTGVLETVLEKNGMLQGGQVIPQSTLSDADKQKIIDSVEYLNRMGYTKSIAWFPAGFEVYRDFSSTFGFSPYDQPDDKVLSVNVSLAQTAVIDVAGYDSLVRATLSGPSGLNGREDVCTITGPGGDCRLVREMAGQYEELVLLDANDGEMARFSTEEIVRRYESYGAASSELSAQEATFTVKGPAAAMTLVVQNAYLNSRAEQTEYTADVYVLVRFSA